MKALVLSDIHSNIFALEAIWSKEDDSDIIYCAGDIVDYGPCPKEVINWIREKKVICVQGNHDQDVIKCYRDSEILQHIPVDQRAWRHHNAQMLNEDDICFLEQLPIALDFELDDYHYGITHRYNDYNVINNICEFQMCCDCRFLGHQRRNIERLIFGHTHRRGVHYLSNSLLWMNPGSASYRRRDDPDQSAHYITITNGLISLEQVAYDLEPLYNHILSIKMNQDEKHGMLWAFSNRRD